MATLALIPNDVYKRALNDQAKYFLKYETNRKGKKDSSRLSLR